MKSRVAGSVALAVTIASVMSACAFITPQQTTKSYTPSDGVNGAAGGVEIRNMLVIASADGKTASLVGALVNTTDSTQDVTVQYATSSGTGSQQVEVPSGLLSLRTDQDASTDGSTPSTSAGTQQVVLDNVDTTLGGLFRVSFLAGSASASLQLPVLNGTFSEYSSLVPTPSPTPTKTKKPKPSDSASAEDTPTPTDTPS